MYNTSFSVFYLLARFPISPLHKILSSSLYIQFDVERNEVKFFEISSLLTSKFHLVSISCENVIRKKFSVTIVICFIVLPRANNKLFSFMTLIKERSQNKAIQTINF